MISCRTLGALEVLVDGAPPPPDLKWKKPLALLLYLAYSPRSTRAKDHLISLLWPDAKEPNQSLSQAQYLLRTRGGVGIAEKSGQIRLDITTVVLDTARLEELVSKGMWADAAGLVSGPFLDGFTVRDAPEFEDWISTQREHWSAKCAEVLVRYADELTNGGATEQALPVAERAQGLAPHADSAEQVRLNALSLLGRRAEALDGYHRFEKRLKVDLGITPDAKTRELVARITDRPIRPSVPSSKKREPPRRAPLVGRQKQLKRIHDCCVRSRESGEAVLGLVLGEPGSGKTRFVEEVLEREHLNGFATAVVHAVRSDLTQPGAGLVALAEGGLLKAPGVPSAPAPALAALAARSSLWAERFHQPNPDDVLSMPRAFSEVVRAATGEQPVLLAVDDAHWMDAESLLALTAVLRDLARRPVVVLLAATPDPPRVELEEIRAHLGRDQKGASVTLDLFSAAELAALSRWALPRYDDEQVERLVRRVQADSGGLPLLAFELISAVASGLDVGPEGVVWPASTRTLYDTFPGDLPDAVVGAVRVNYSRLTADAQLALMAAAVIGERVPRKQIERASGLTTESLDRALDELEWQRWLVSETRGYAFLARIIRDLVLPMKTKGERARLRERAGLEPE